MNDCTPMHAEEFGGETDVSQMNLGEGGGGKGVRQYDQSHD